MRLDARKGDTGWDCYDAKRCCEVKHVVSVDEDTATWEEHPAVLTMADRVRMSLGGDWPTTLHQEERIRIYPDRRLVVFNEIDLGDDEQLQVDEIISRPAEVTPA